jgi:hypothetical protein
MSEIIYLSNVRLSFPKLVEAAAPQNQPTAAKKFGADFLMAPNHPDYAKFMGEVGKAATEKWKENAGAILNIIQSERKNRCYGLGNEKLDKKTLKPYGGYDGVVYISANSSEDKPPQMILADGTVCPADNTMQRQVLARKLYGGCYVNAAIRPWIQDNSYGRAIRCELVGVQFAADGEAFGEAPVVLTFGAVQGAPAATPAFPGMPAFFGG